jgi:hypothetical protein
VVKAIVCRILKNKEFLPVFTSQWSDTSSFVNKTSALENCETSAVGRALAFMGIGVIDSIASVDEVNKTTYTSPSPLKQTNTDGVVREPINTLKVHCETCGTEMVEFHGKRKSDGKPFDAWRCPKDSNHKLRFI